MKWQAILGFISGILFYRFLLDKTEVKNYIKGKLKQIDSNLNADIKINPQKPKFWKFRQRKEYKKALISKTGKFENKENLNLK